MSELVGTPEDRFSRVTAQIIMQNYPILNLVQRSPEDNIQ